MVPSSDPSPIATDKEAETTSVIQARRPAPFARVADPRFVMVRCSPPHGRRPSGPDPFRHRREPLP